MNTEAAHTEQPNALYSAAPATDAVLGVVPGRVARPKTVEEAALVLREANEAGQKVCVRGSGTKLDRGNPPKACDVLLDVSGLSGIVEHAAGDMTVSVRAGTQLKDLQSVLGQAGQFLAVDPPFPGTVGGLIATGDSGPRRLRYGGVRDLILGVTFLRADGVLVKGGGKVVKNVAGYDLPKLLTGSLGTLGVVVEANFRLYPVPPAAVTAAARCSVHEASRWAANLVKAGLVPTSADYLSTPGGEIAAIRFEGSPTAARTEAERAVTLSGLSGVTASVLGQGEAASIWGTMDASVAGGSGPDDVLARLITTSSGLPALVESARRAAQEASTQITVRAHLRHGHALLLWHEPAEDKAVDLVRALRIEAARQDSSLVVWKAPMAVRAEIDVWADVGEGLPLMRRVKDQFDPKHTLNSGRFVGGI